MERGCAVAMSSEVFGDGAEACAGVGSAGFEVGFAGVLVEEFAGVANDTLEVGASGAGEGTVPTQRGNVVLGSKLIGESQEGLLIGRGIGLSEGGWGGDHQDRQREQEPKRSCFRYFLHLCREMRLTCEANLKDRRSWFLRLFR